jgi:hypothetical protein
MISNPETSAIFDIEVKTPGGLSSDHRILPWQHFAPHWQNKNFVAESPTS